MKKERLFLVMFFLFSNNFFGIDIKNNNSNKKTVLIVNVSFPTDSTQVISTILMLKKLGYDVSLYAYKKIRNMGGAKRKLYQKLGIIDIYNKLYLPNEKDIVVQKLKKNEFDLVVAMLGGCGQAIAHIKKEYNLKFPLYVKYTGADISHNYENKKEKIISYLPYINQFLPVSEHFKNLLIEIGVPINKITVLPSIVLTNFFYPKEIDKDEKFYILSVGRLIEKKGFDVGIKAIAQLIKKYPSLHYYIVGGGKKNEEEELLQLVNKLECYNNVTFVGNVSLCKMVDYYVNANILLIPSRIAKSGDMEGIPRVAKEAMAMNIPVIATDCSGVQEITKDKESAFIIKPNNIQDIIDIISEIIENRQILKKIIKNARKIILKNHSLKAVSSIFQSILK